MFFCNILLEFKKLIHLTGSGWENDFGGQTWNSVEEMLEAEVKANEQEYDPAADAEQMENEFMNGG